MSDLSFFPQKDIEIQFQKDQIDDHISLFDNIMPKEEAEYEYNHNYYITLFKDYEYIYRHVPFNDIDNNMEYLQKNYKKNEYLLVYETLFNEILVLVLIQGKYMTFIEIPPLNKIKEDIKEFIDSFKLSYTSNCEKFPNSLFLFDNTHPILSITFIEKIQKEFPHLNKQGLEKMIFLSGLPIVKKNLQAVNFGQTSKEA